MCGIISGKETFEREKEVRSKIAHSFYSFNFWYPYFVCSEDWQRKLLIEAVKA